MQQLAAWIKDINEDYLAGWANRGLLRRGRKLGDSVSTDACTVTESDCTATIEEHTQKLTAPGFEHLSCTCPAPAACHHLIAFLLCLQQHPDLDAGVEESEDSNEPPPWLAEDITQIEKQLGKTYFKRAQRTLLQAPQIDLDDSSGSLIAHITDSSQNTVRIPRSVGLSASICTCNAERCVHRALAILSARQQAGLYDPTEDVDEALEPQQREVVQQLQDWLRELVMQGSAGISRALVERGEALATVARQADFPLLSSNVTGLVKLQQDELAGRSFLEVGHFRTRIAPLWTRLKALQATPLPQPLSRLAGDHKRYYKLIHNVQLIGVGAETWHSQTDYLGLTLHLYDPVNNEWYRHSQVRGAKQAEDSGWSPQQCWQRDALGSVNYRRIPGAKLRLIKGWHSGDRRLSGRDGTVVELETENVADAQLPITTRFAELAERYSQVLVSDPVAPPPLIPVIVRTTEADKPAFNSIEQVWSQELSDDEKQQLRLAVTVSDVGNAIIRKTLDRLWRRGKRWDLVFGLLGYREQSLLLRPVSIRCTDEIAWTHLSLEKT